MAEFTKISLVTDKAVLLLFDSDNTPEVSTGFELEAGESYYDDEIVIAKNIRFVNKNAGETPRVRGIAWGT